MPATRTALGTAASKTPGTSWDALTSIALSAGDTLLVGTSQSNTNNQITGITWNGIALTGIAVITPSVVTGIWLLKSSEHSGGTGTINVAFASGVETALVATKYSGLDSDPFDQKIEATTFFSGATTAPDSGDTPTTTQNDEVLWAVHGANSQAGGFGSPAAGSDTTSTGQSVTTIGGGSGSTQEEIVEAFGVQTATGVRHSARTGMTSQAWTSVLVTLKIAAVAAPDLRYVIAPDVAQYPRSITPGGMTPSAHKVPDVLVG